MIINWISKKLGQFAARALVSNKAFAESVASQIDMDQLAEKLLTHIDIAPEDVARCFNACNIAEHVCVSDVAAYMSSSAVAEHLDISDADIAKHFKASDIAEHIDCEEVAGYVDVSASDVAEHVNIDSSDVAEHFNIDASEVAEHIDLEDVAKHLDHKKVADGIDLDYLIAHVDISEREVGNAMAGDTRCRQILAEQLLKTIAKELVAVNQVRPSFDEGLI